jgi:hypothetical protein
MKAIKLLLFAAFTLLTVSVFAQDSTQVKVVTDVLAGFEVKYTWLTPLLGALVVISELLSYIPSIKANGVFQLIFGWINAIGKKK